MYRGSYSEPMNDPEYEKNCDDGEAWLLGEIMFAVIIVAGIVFAVLRSLV